MNKIKIYLVLLLYPALTANASIQNDSLIVETKIKLQTKTGDIFGTLTTSEKLKTGVVALIIAGSGPTDRDGNNPMMKNNSLKLLAHELSRNGIATLRYDKRGIGESTPAVKSESDIRFDDYVNDATGWIELLKQDKRFSKVIVIGHSEGSLIGMIASGADKFVSIAGAGQSADKILKEQLATQPKAVQDLTFPMLESLKNGKMIDSVPPMLNALFRPSIQPYMISWFKYDPQYEINKLFIPILIVQGTNDMQVSVQDARRLSEANKAAELLLIHNMNHVLRIVDGDKQANFATYSKGEVAIARELLQSITAFILR